MAFSLNDFLEKLATLVGSITAYVPGTNLFCGQLQEEPLNGIAVIDTGGPFFSGDKTRNLEFQVLVRNTNAETARSLAGIIQGVLEDKFVMACSTPAAMPGYTGRITAQHEVGAHTFDENAMPVYILNYRFLGARA